MKKRWLSFLMAAGLVLSMAAPSVYASEDSKPGGLQKMIQKALGGEEDDEKHVVERDVKQLLLKIENKAKAEGLDVEELLGSAIAGLQEENIDLSMVDDLAGGMLGIGEDAEPQDEAETEEFVEMPGRTTPGPETVDVGDFTVDVPEGWLGVRDPSWDVEGEFETYLYDLIKGGETSQDKTFDAPVVSIYLSENYDAESLMEMNAGDRDEYSEIDVALDEKDCKAVHTIMILGEDSIETDFVYIPVSDSSCIRIMIDTFAYGTETGITANDSDVLAIMNSIQVK